MHYACPVCKCPVCALPSLDATKAVAAKIRRIFNPNAKDLTPDWDYHAAKSLIDTYEAAKASR